MRETFFRTAYKKYIFVPIYFFAVFENMYNTNKKWILKFSKELYMTSETDKHTAKPQLLNNNSHRCFGSDITIFSRRKTRNSVFLDCLTKIEDPLLFFATKIKSSF